MKKELDSLMEKNGIDGFICMGGPAKSKNTYYMTGPLKLTGGYVIKKKGAEPVLLHGSMERDEAAKSGMTCVSMSDLDSVNIHRNAKNVFEGNLAFTKKILDHFELSGAVAFYGNGPVAYYHHLFKRLEAELDNFKIAEELENNLFAQMRVTKDDDEIKRIKAHGQKAQRVVAETRDFIASHHEKNGLVVKEDGSPLTIGEAKKRIEELVNREGMVVEVDTIFAQGRDAGIPHSHGTDDDPMRTGKTIVFDFFPKEKGGGYFWDMTRTLIPGHVPDAEGELYETVLESQKRVLEALELGREMKSFDDLVNDYFESLGHPTLRKDQKTQNGYVHSLGHGVGLDLHERPRVSSMSKESDTLKPGYVFTVEPGLYYPEKEMGVRIEDIVAVWEDGRIENLTTLDKDPLVKLRS